MATFCVSNTLYFHRIGGKRKFAASAKPLSRRLKSGHAQRAERSSEVVLPCHITRYSALPTHATMLSVLRLMAAAYQGRYPEAVSQRISTLAAIDEELDLFE